MRPALAFLYSPFTSLCSQMLIGVSINTSKNWRPDLVWRLRALSRSYVHTVCTCGGRGRGGRGEEERERRERERRERERRERERRERERGERERRERERREREREGEEGEEGEGEEGEGEGEEGRLVAPGYMG